jgi:iron complex transport system substrate-binding protein
MAPDFIIAGGRPQTQVPALLEIAPTIDMTISGETLIADAEARIDAYGTMFDLKEEAATLQVNMDEAIANAQDAVAGKGNALILLTNGGKVSAYGDDYRFGWLGNPPIFNGTLS